MKWTFISTSSPDPGHKPVAWVRDSASVSWMTSSGARGEMPETAATDGARRRALASLAGVLGIAVIGVLDYRTGIQVRVFPLYYAPLALLAWYFGRLGALIATGLCVVAWFSSNVLAGLQYTHPGIWLVNTLMQGFSFAIVGFLLAAVRAALSRERALSRTDPLTSMLNRLGFSEAGERLLALCQRNQRPITLAYIDLDRFKAINDERGHQAGDDVLRTVADLFRLHLRPSDVAGRLGGDEFIVLFPEIGGSEAVPTLERLRSAFTDATTAGRLPVTASIGGITFPRAPERVDDLLRLGDALMYSAKAEGGNRLNLEIRGEP